MDNTEMMLKAINNGVEQTTQLAANQEIFANELQKNIGKCFALDAVVRQILASLLKGESEKEKIVAVLKKGLSGMTSTLEPDVRKICLEHGNNIYDDALAISKNPV